MSTKIELILASAGTGKTTRLATELQHALESGKVRPEAVVATTFTRQAAAELAERARTRLLSVGRHGDAHRLQAARIGTVNAVCGRLVEDFAFELGLSPDVRVIDDVAAARMLRESLSTVMENADQQRMAELRSRMEQLEVEVNVAQVVASARANGMDTSGVEASKQRSLELGRAVLGERDQDGAAIDRALVEAMRALVEAIPADETVKKAIKARNRCRRDLSALDHGHRLKWRQWASLSSASTLDAGKKYRPIAAAVREAATAHDRHPLFHDDVLQAIELVFTLAGRTLIAYEQRKRAAGVIDFVDQEAYALSLLRRPNVAERLAEEIDLVMVDEFQDTSPLQLAIFLELAKIAPRSVWVGDQKQSIYGFRGTDPDLMEAALELLERRDPAFVDDTLAALFEQTTPQNLTHSWRSRPGLVDLTSAVFARAFARHGMPAERVRLQAGHPDEPEGLGPTVEIWDLRLENMSRTTLFPSALAAGVDAFLSGHEGEAVPRVRDRATGQARDVRLSDVAVLSRRKKTGRDLAEALEGLGRRVILPRPGLLKALEGRLATAALRYFTQPRDALAVAEIERLTRFSDAPAAWLQSLVEAACDETAQGESERPVSPVLDALDRLRQTHSNVDPATALDLCIAAVDLRTLCRQWGEARQRLGNLDALCDLARTYVQTRHSELRVATVPGLLAHFEQLVEDEADEQAVLADDEAITISTWHAAKGLEWPVTILFDLVWDRPPDIAGVSVEPGRERFDLRDPLADRWIRYLPQPFWANQRKVSFMERAAQMDFTERARVRGEREQLRLLYVAWTRARDRLILAGPAAKMYETILACLCDEDGTPLLQHPQLERATWADCTFDVIVREFEPSEPRPRSTEPGHVYPVRDVVEHPPAFLSPSSVNEPGALGEVFELGSGFAVHGVDPQSLGDAVHGFFAADDPGAEAGEREALAAALLRRFAVTVPGLAAHVVQAADALQRFVGQRWPGAMLRRELPVWHRTASGTVVRGTADVVLEHAGGYAVIDHKILLGSPERALRDVPQYAGQLERYAQAITAATGKEVRETWVHLPLAGRLVSVRPGA